MRITLDGISNEPVEIATKGKVYKADPDLTASEALYFMRVMNGAEVNVLADQYVPKWAAIVSRCMLPYHPEMTPEKTLDTLSLRELVGIIGSFLALIGQTLPTTLPTPPKQELPTTPGPTTTEASV